ncbi:tRNA(Ser) Um(44) 2'-O-methyltransferase [Trapelia coarctata]|nr:tRNA(Ser) Um(44) 2'-O-methyltransferase [Trapelia coarctata]
MSFVPTQLLPDGTADHRVVVHRLRSKEWVPVLQHECDFGPDYFEQVSINLIRNPNINSTHLFRADILYDSLNNEYTNTARSVEEVERLLREFALEEGSCPGFQVKRTMIRLMVPRNPQLDKPIAQTCYLMQSHEANGTKQSLVVYVPHVSQLEELPWYHPTVQRLAFLHTWLPEHGTSDLQNGSEVSPLSENHQGAISIHFQLFPTQTFPLPPRLLRTAHHLLLTLHKHGQGCRAGYTKRVHHDQLITQQRVQDTYAELKRKYAKRLCDAWVEQTEPSKHVFEDLGIAAFLIELWKDMYRPASSSQELDPRPPFPGFVDIGCGNGVLTEILLLSGYPGWGFDVRRRKTWAILSESTQTALRELILIPSPLFDLSTPLPQHPSVISRVLSGILPKAASTLETPSQAWHNGLFPTGTFIISNHADEITPWTPLLASLSNSPFLAIPCCSHNLSGMRFRAPSVFNSNTADTHAPAFFSKNVTKSKSVAISIAAHIGTESGDENEEEKENSEFAKFLRASDSLNIFKPPQKKRSSILSYASSKSKGHSSHATPLATPRASPPRSPAHAAETGDLRTLAPVARAKQPSAYSSLCDWVAHLASEVGYVVEKEVLRIPSTRNVGIIGRAWLKGRREEGEKEKRERVVEIARREGADGRVWVKRCVGLAKGGGGGEHECGHG